MNITQVRVFPVEEDKLKAFVSIILDDCFVVSDIKIIQGNNGLFISMPSKKRKNGTFRDIAHPLNNETRRKLEETIIAKYQEVLATDGGVSGVAMRRLELDGDGADDLAAGAAFEERAGKRSGEAHLVLGSPRLLLGRRQVVRHGSLEPAFGGSNPPAPANGTGDPRRN